MRMMVRLTSDSGLKPPQTKPLGDAVMRGKKVNIHAYFIDPSSEDHSKVRTTERYPSIPSSSTMNMMTVPDLMIFTMATAVEKHSKLMLSLANEISWLRRKACRGVCVQRLSTMRVARSG